MYALAHCLIYAAVTLLDSARAADAVAISTFHPNLSHSLLQALALQPKNRPHKSFLHACLYKTLKAVMFDPKDYTVGWICAVDSRFVAAQTFLDEKHNTLIPKGCNDNYN